MEIEQHEKTKDNDRRKKKKKLELYTVFIKFFSFFF